MFLAIEVVAMARRQGVGEAAPVTPTTPLHAKQDLVSACVRACGLSWKQAKAAPTWPFDHKMVTQVLGTALAPVAIYLLKLAGGLLQRQLFSQGTFGSLPRHLGEPFHQEIQQGPHRGRQMLA